MKTVYKLSVLTLMMWAASVYGFSQDATGQTPLTTTQNLIRGVTGPVGSNNSWANYSVFNLVPGSGLFPITSSTTVFYYGFTAGTEADIGGMVVYTTARASSKITAVTPVTLGGVSNPTINLASPSVCPVAPSSATPCIVRLDPTTLTLSPASDYYLVVYFTTSTNNSSIGATQPVAGRSSLASFYTGGTDYTHLTVGQSLPGSANGSPTFLMYVMNN